MNATPAKRGAVVLALFALSAFAAAVSARLTHTAPACEPGACGVPALPSWRIDVNHADAGELALLPGVGPSLAGRIIADRAAHGLYRTVEDLDRVKGIGPQLLAKIRPNVVIRGAAEEP